MSCKTAPRIFIFSIVLGAEYLSYVKSIDTHVRAFLTLNILSIGTVNELFVFIEMKQKKIFLKKKIQNGRLKNLIFQLRQFSIFFHELVLGLVEHKNAFFACYKNYSREYDYWLYNTDLTYFLYLESWTKNGFHWYALR